MSEQIEYLDICIIRSLPRYVMLLVVVAAEVEVEVAEADEPVAAGLDHDFSTLTDVVIINGVTPLTW